MERLTNPNLITDQPIVNRLCEYENTGLTPKQIEQMKKSAIIKRCQRKRIVGVPKNIKKLIIYGHTREEVAKALNQIKR